jgi:hypothetical protein
MQMTIGRRSLRQSREVKLCVIIHHTCKKAPKGVQGFSVFDAMLGTTGIGTVVDCARENSASRRQ